jgi:hypothetical protein
VEQRLDALVQAVLLAASLDFDPRKVSFKPNPLETTADDLLAKDDCPRHGPVAHGDLPEALQRAGFASAEIIARRRLQ